jgi:hypothetical protein
MRMSGRWWAYAGALLGGLVSIAANVAHSYVPPQHAAEDWQPQAGAVVGAVFWPVALFVAIEILARVAWPAGWRWAVLRFLGLLPVAAVAAIVSYRHLSGLLEFYGEDWLTVVIGPLAVDGLMVMATGALIATSRQRRTTNTSVAIAPVTDLATVADRVATVPAIELATERPTEPAAMATPVAKPRPTARPPVAKATATRVAKLVAKDPAIDAATVAEKLAVSPRTARRYLATAKPPATRVNGHTPDLAEVTP